MNYKPMVGTERLRRVHRVRPELGANLPRPALKHECSRLQEAGGVMQIKNLERSKGADRFRPALKHRATSSVSAKETQRTDLLARH